MSLSDSEEFSPRLEWGDIEDEYEVEGVEEPVYLDSPWTFWYDVYPGPGLTAEQYAGAMRKIATVDNIQDFWGIYNNLPGLETIPNKSSYHLMKYESLPLWEDEANINGGNFSFKIKSSDAEHVWVQMLVRVVGEQFYESLHAEDDIQGISVNMRAGGEAAIYFWNKNASLVSTSKIINKLYEVLQGVDFVQEPSYRVHKEEVNFLNPSPRKHRSHNYSSPNKSAGAKGTTSPKRGNSPPKAASKSPKKEEESYKKKKKSYSSSYKGGSPHKSLQYVYVPIAVHN